ncbi:zinc ribbon domain-containing protein [Paenibacillus abyssi]|uniref:Zinc ribbon domain-containing protein n=1 Tax=Paenibacillus abyssi TaxID=1340531 RepID=A0A917FU42_9BACL|nr:zinc ribbon domain-containing protein [Paenibacillus abyssi]GGG08981.1 hypothetical protein GCM10010916_27230 [Paenibacillus abyssi]
MSFFDKLKTGVTEAGNKAKVAVELNRLKMQNSTKQKEIAQHYEEIGKQVFMSVAGRSPEFQDEQIRPFIDRVLQLEAEIQSNLQQMKTISDEQECVCGKTVALDTRFCPHCGHQFATTNQEV